MAEHADAPPDKRARPTVTHPFNASQNWSAISRHQLPIVLTVTERPNVRQLLCFANGLNGGKLMSELKGSEGHADADDDEDMSMFSNKTARAVIRLYLKNIKSQDTVVVNYTHDIIGHMLITEGIISHSRIYPISDTLKYPFSIQQLPKFIRELAIGCHPTKDATEGSVFNMTSYDDNNAFHRIIYGITKNEDAKSKSREIFDDAQGLYQRILTDPACKFKHSTEATDIKTAIHAIANGQSLETTRDKLGDVSEWLAAWHCAQGQVTDELCRGDKGTRGLQLIGHYMPKKEKLVTETVDGKRITKRKQVDRNCKATLRSFMSQAPEAKGLMVKLDFFKAQGVTHILPLHDDCMANTSQCNAIEQALGNPVEDLLTKEVKADAYENALVKCKKISLDPELELVDLVDSDCAAAEMIIGRYPHWVCCNNVLYVFDEMTGMYNNTESAHMVVATKFRDSLYSGKREVEDGVEFIKADGYSYGSNLSKFRAMIPYIKSLVVDNTWEDRTDRSAFGKLLWKNGVYDIKTRQFTEGFDPGIVFHGRIDRNFRTIEDLDDESSDIPLGQDYVNSILRRIFIEPLDEDIGKYYVHMLARGLAGENCDMGQFICGIGVTMSGKGVLTSALNIACGDYVNTFSAESLKHTERSTDEAAMLRWAFLLRYSRIIVSNELSVKTKLSGTRLKCIAGRGDELKGRVHSGLETSFTPHFLMVLLANDLPQINPCDDAVVNRATVLEYEKSFVAVPNGPCELLMDENIKSEVRTARFCDAFVHLLISAYHTSPEMPEAMTRAKDEWLGIEDNNVISMFSQQAIFTDDPDDFLTNAAITSWLHRNGFECTITKMNTELKRHIGNTYSRIAMGQKKIAGQKSRGWFGIQLPQDVDFD